ncbi:MAG TPA: cell division protein FtsL [Firmicutes bacterium]|nr:cell division protein FtsL [Bacillota bacterium]
MSAVRDVNEYLWWEEAPVKSGSGTNPSSVHKRRSQRRAAYPLTVIAVSCALVACLAMGLVIAKVKVMTLTYELREMQAELEREERRHGYLLLAVEAARSPQRLEMLAREKLGMQKPRQVEYLVMAGPDTETDAPAPVGGEAGAPRFAWLTAINKWLAQVWDNHGTTAAAAAAAGKSR